MERLLWSFLFSILVTNSLGRMCPDGSTCTDDSTCCEVDGGRYGCCPLVDAVCCDDKEHCCPNGYSCSEGICFKSDHGNKLNVSTDCPGGQYVCPTDNTCCPYGDEYTCCPLPDATCCSDGLHCCPHGTTCDVAHETCNVPITKIANTATGRSKVNVVVCPGGEFECPDDNTCCLLTTGEYGCCPLPNAVCCDDKVHCCPAGYTCNAGSCAQLATSSPVNINSVQIPLSVIEPELTAISTTDYVQCPDGVSTCPDQNTCCQLSTGKYGCCPLPQANCCSDKIHCCPNGSQCDVAHGRCTSGIDDEPTVVPWVEKVPAMPRQPEFNEV